MTIDKDYCKMTGAISNQSSLTRRQTVFGTSLGGQHRSHKKTQSNICQF